MQIIPSNAGNKTWSVIPLTNNQHQSNLIAKFEKKMQNELETSKELRLQSAINLIMFLNIYFHYSRMTY